MRNEMVLDIQKGLQGIGVQAEVGQDTDLVIVQEFLDAKWSTGKKSISYEASIFISEQEKIVFMHEKTTEIGGGLSFGSGSESYSQSGTTLMRKVKSVQYGPEGKAYEIELNLGAIPKTVKEIALAAGYTFKTVVMKKKALYPAGYVPPVALDQQSAVDQELPVESQEPESPAIPAPPEIPGTPATTEPIPKVEPPLASSTPAAPKGLVIATIGLGVLTLLWNLALGVSPIGWFLGAAIVVLFFSLSQTKGRGNLLKGILFFVGALILVFLVSVFTGDLSTEGSNNAESRAGQKSIEQGKILKNFEISPDASWKSQMKDDFGTLYVYSKADGEIYSSASIAMSPDLMEDNALYKKGSKEYAKYAPVFGSEVSVDLVKLAGYETLRIVQEEKNVQVTTYLYFINIPGEFDIFLTVASATSEIKDVVREWEGFMKELKLNYE